MARPLGITLLVLGLGGSTLGGVALGAPDLVQAHVAPAIPDPSGPGPRPELPAELAAEVAPQEARKALLLPPPVAHPPRPVTLAAPVVAGERPAAPKAAQGYIGDDAARAAVAEAEREYRAMAWAKARAAAQRAVGLDANPALKSRARELVDGATALEALFKALDDREELARNYDTHPALVRIDGGREPVFALPIRSVSDKEPVIIDREPLTYIAQMKTVGKVPLLVRGRKDFFPTTLTEIGAVQLVDQRQVAEEKRREFRDRLARLSGSAASLDPVAWYEAGRFAYRNRLDDLVVAQLDQALRLDPNLVRTVREDRAAGLFAHLTAQMRAGNRAQAAAYMAAIDRRYQDTEQGRQARLYFDGKHTELLKVTQAVPAVPAPAAAPVAPAPVPAATAKVPATPAADPGEPAPAPTPAAKDPAAQADAVFAQGRELYAQAIDLGNTKERDAAYGEADRVLTQAVALYQALIAKTKDPKAREDLEIKLVEANKLRFGCKKQRRF